MRTLNTFKDIRLSAIAAVMPFQGIRNSSYPLWRTFLLPFMLVLALWFVPSLPVVSAYPVTLSSDTLLATAGYYRLSWQAKGLTNQYRLLESRNPRFDHNKVIYEGPDLATVLSGKANGSYYYRVAVLDHHTPIAVSNTVKVEVVHHSLYKALLFFALGAGVFLATLLLILRGNRHN